MTILRTLLIVRHGNDKNDHLTEEGRRGAATVASYINGRHSGDLREGIIIPCRKHARTRETAVELTRRLGLRAPTDDEGYDCDSHAMTGMIIALWRFPLLILVGHTETTEDLPGYIGAAHNKRMWGFETRPNGLVSIDFGDLTCKHIKVREETT